MAMAGTIISQATEESLGRICLPSSMLLSKTDSTVNGSPNFSPNPLGSLGHTTRERTSDRSDSPQYSNLSQTHARQRSPNHRQHQPFREAGSSSAPPPDLLNNQQSLRPSGMFSSSHRVKHDQELVLPECTKKAGQTNPIDSGHSTTTSSLGQRTNDRISRSYEHEVDNRAVKLAADCLHAQDYTRMLSILAGESGSIAVQFGRGLAYYKLKKFQEAIESFSDMLRLSSMDLLENGNLYLAHYYLGEIEVAHGRYKNAAKHYQKASMSYTTDTVAKRYRIVQPSRAAIFSKLGSARRHSQQVMEAVKAYKDALSVAETKKDKLAVNTSLGNLYQSLGENASALQQYEDTIELAEELKDYVSLGWAYGNMGNAYLGLYQKDKALKYLEKSLDLTVEHEPTPQAIGRAYNNLGTAYQSLNELKKAEEYYDLALSQAIYGVDIGGQARVYGNYGNLLMIQKRYDPAIVHYSEALAISSDRSTRSTAHHNRGCAYYEKAEASKKRLMDITTTTKPEKSSECFHITYNGPSVKNEPQEPPMIPSMQSDYSQGRDDLVEVVAYHEETFQTIKGSSHGLSFSVSLFETNSRTFHRLQDCLFNLGEWDKALEFAEQSRARTLGELLLQRKTGQLPMELSSPLKMSQIERIIESVHTTVVFMSYTGARLLTWVFTPHEGRIVTNMFQVSLEDDQFEGKSLDYFLRFTLAEKLIDDSPEMYSSCSYNNSPPLTRLFQIFGEPLLRILNNLNQHGTSIRDIVVVPDSYTNLIPLMALLNSASGKFLGDRFCFRIIPSLLTLGILSQQPDVVVRVPEESQNFCIVGNPTIPTFKYQDETWNLGKLPFATLEAESVAHVLRGSPTLHEQATKMLVLSMISGAKVIHLATHGSASAGFLAFAGLGSSRSRSVSDEKLVLLYPEEIEKLAISPALVVLSSCDSGRGAVKADGIQGMARAFILAGARAVLTTLWRVPDESAAVFMQFFYQYMMDGFKGSRALQKAMLSIRSFRKYARYIHWSGYQLTGQEVQFEVTESGAMEDLKQRMGPPSVFPRLDNVKTLEKHFIKDPYLPTDVQVIMGLPSLKPSEVVTEFVHSYHSHFTGGIFFVSATNSHYMTAAEERITMELEGTDTEKDPMLLIFDNLTTLPCEGSYLYRLMSKSHTHIVILLDTSAPLDSLKRSIDTKLMRGTNVMELEPLSELQCTQRLVHGIMNRCDFVPYNREQEILAEVADKTLGSPELVDVSLALLSKYITAAQDSEQEGENDFLERFHSEVCASDNASDFPTRLLKSFSLSESQFFLLSTLSLFGNSPIPRHLVEAIQLLSLTASSELPNGASPLDQLTSSHLLNVSPSTVILSPTTATTSPSTNHLSHNTEFYCVPTEIADAVRSTMDDKDLAFSYAIAHKALSRLHGLSTAHSGPFMTGIAKVLADSLVKHSAMQDCYKELYRTYLLYAIH